jgi:hypothetical protein
MIARRSAPALALVLLGAALVAGFVGVLEKRFVEGAVYPHYASYRNDPLGTSALYESLERLEGVEVSRNLRHLQSVTGLDGDTVLLLLGYPRDGFEDLRAPDDSPVMRAVEEGARLVLTINPGTVPELFRPERTEQEEDWMERRRKIREARSRRAAAEKSEQGAEGSEEDEEDEEDEEEAKLEREMASAVGQRLTAKLRFEVTAPGYEARPENGWETVGGEGAFSPPPSELPVWRSQYRLDPKDEAWRAAVLVGEDPVVIERPWGEGSVVIASDSYFASNEGLHLGSSPEFLLWLLGGKAKAVFDETIHGTLETGGAMKLIRRYRAHGVFFGLLVFFALWAWRSASPLVPGSEAQDRGLVDGSGTVMGEGSGTGFLRLLRRSVPPAELLGQCLASWRASLAAEPPEAVGRDLAEIAGRHRADPKAFGAAEAYRAVAERLRKR